MRTAAISTGVGVVLAIGASGAMALGFGSVHNATVLGQPLSFSVPLRMDADEFVAVECVSATVYSGDNRVPPSQVQLQLEAARDGSGRVLRVTTSVLIDEPVVTVDVGVGCPVRLSRKFVAFVDPPIVTLAQAEPARAPEPSAAPAAAPAAAPPVAVQPAPPRAERPAAAPAPRSAQARRPRALARPSTIVAPDATRPRSRAQAAPAARATAPAPAPSNGGARLQLEAAQALDRPASAPQAAASAPAPLSPDAAAAQAAPAASAVDAQAVERERIRVLEENLARIRSDSEATRNSINALQARLRDEEARRYNNPLVYTLVAVIAALLFAMGLLVWWARARERQRAEWWMAGGDEAPQRPAAEPAPVPASKPAPLTAAPDSVASTGFIEDSTRPAMGPVTWKPTLAIPELDKNEVPKRPVSAEELIDLEQQAEFFVTLGQDDAAIDLLVGHLNSAGGTSPLPYLKLMEIHRRRGDLPAYERIREHFNQRFNAYAPPGDAPLPPQRSLEDHPELMAQLQDAWPTPPRAMGLLESLLFKSGEGDAAFDLAAYREVLFLHEVARDLFEHTQSSVTVDVLLPLDEGPQSVLEPHAASGVMPLHATTKPLPVDLDLGRPRDEEAEQAAARTERRRERYGDDDFQFGSGTGSGFGDLGPGGSSGRKR